MRFGKSSRRTGGWFIEDLPGLKLTSSLLQVVSRSSCQNAEGVDEQVEKGLKFDKGEGGEIGSDQGKR